MLMLRRLIPWSRGTPRAGVAVLVLCRGPSYYDTMWALDESGVTGWTGYAFLFPSSGLELYEASSGKQARQTGCIFLAQ